MLGAAGFEQVVVDLKPQSAEFISQWLPGSGCEEFVCAANITAVKPSTTACCPPQAAMAGPAAMPRRMVEALERKAAKPKVVPPLPKAGPKKPC
mmetsp:Transcript_17306/g.38861  ORF Transcript_17306/g.38861 Transcript_17306/m.38861 type:complete len:94 (-) Transcript_17306:762-1043(-)